jgi:hypothetical protein
MEGYYLAEFLLFSPDKELQGGGKETRRLKQDDRKGNDPKMGQSILQHENEKGRPTRLRPLNDTSYTKFIASNKIGKRLPLASR